MDIDSRALKVITDLNSKEYISDSQKQNALQCLIVNALKENQQGLEFIAELSAKIARDLFILGDEPESKTKRIQFLGGEYPNNETEQGGLCEFSLAEVIKNKLTIYLAK